MRVIWAYGLVDPENPSLLDYHGTRRGVRSLYMLQPQNKRFEFGPDVKYFDFKMDNVSSKEIRNIF